MAIGEKYGDVRAKSSRLRETVGRLSSCSVETFAAGPVRDGLMIGIDFGFDRHRFGDVRQRQLEVERDAFRRAAR